MIDWHHKGLNQGRIVQAIMQPLCIHGIDSLPPARSDKLLAAALLLLALCLVFTGCATVVSNATSGLAANLSSAILNQDDPETVRDGAPTLLLMLDSFAESNPDDAGMLAAAAELYAAYGVLFVDDPKRAERLTDRARAYSERALCVSNAGACDMANLPFKDYRAALEELGPADLPALYTFSLTWLAAIRSRPGDMLALAELPRAEAALRRVAALDDSFREAEVAHYLGVLSTLRPPALGGKFEEGRAHFERAIALTDGQALTVKVDFARYYARTLYERDLHDRLLQEVLNADPVAEDLTLFNTLAQRQAAELLASADDYF